MMYKLVLALSVPELVRSNRGPVLAALLPDKVIRCRAPVMAVAVEEISRPKPAVKPLRDIPKPTPVVTLLPTILWTLPSVCEPVKVKPVVPPTPLEVTDKLPLLSMYTRSLPDDWRDKILPIPRSSMVNWGLMVFDDPALGLVVPDKVE